MKSSNLEYKDFETFCGIPLDDAIKIIEMYKYAKDARTSSYLQGWEAGYKAAFQDVINNQNTEEIPE